MKILGHDPKQVADFAEQEIGTLVRDFGAKKDYGYLTVFDAATDGGVILICKIGICPPEKADKYLALSQEKARRLLANQHHITSFQSRDPENGKWGGAVRAGSLIISFSGLPELDDEAVSAFVARQMGCIDKSRMVEIAAGSINPHILPF